MATMKIMTGEGKYLDNDAIRNVTDYVIRNAKSCTYCGVSEEWIAEEMELVQEYFDQTDGKRIFHFVISFARKDNPSEYRLNNVCKRICELFAKDYQIVAAIHTNSSYPHIHFAMNTVNYNTGEKFHQNRKEFYQMRKDIAERLYYCGITMRNRR